LVVQNKAKDLVIGTHGRSIYKIDISHIQKYTDIKDKELVIFDIDNIRHSKNWGSSWSKWFEANEPKLDISYYSSSSGNKTIKIISESGLVLNQWNVETVKGFNKEGYDFTFSEKGLKAYNKENKESAIEKSKNEKYYLPKGKYSVKIDNISKEFEVK